MSLALLCSVCIATANVISIFLCCKYSSFLAAVECWNHVFLISSQYDEVY